MKQSVYKHYLLAILLVILAFNYVDRLALGLVLQDIKSDLDLTDTELGFLSGIAFALFYSIMGIPIARWADRGNRVTIITVTTALWSAAVALCGVAASFTQLLLIRIGVAVGEAGCIPPAHSLIADTFDRAERARAVARYMLGGPTSVVIGYFVAGWLNELYGWRTMFIVLGLPGLALAVLAWFGLKEPRRTSSLLTDSLQLDDSVRPRPDAAEQAPEPGIREVCATLWRNSTFRHLLIYFSIASFFSYGILQWQPAFFIRSYGLDTGELGTWFAVIYGVGGLLGTYCGGEWASRRAANNEHVQLKAVAAVNASFGIIAALVYLAPNLHLAFALLGITAVGGVIANGPLFGTIQTLVPQRMRAMSIALIYLFANFIGMGLGPLAAGALSDTFRVLVGEESLRYALLALCPGYFWGAWHLWKACKTVTRDLQLVQFERQIEGGGAMAVTVVSAPAKH